MGLLFFAEGKFSRLLADRSQVLSRHLAAEEGMAKVQGFIKEVAGQALGSWVLAVEVCQYLHRNILRRCGQLPARLEFRRDRPFPLGASKRFLEA